MLLRVAGTLEDPDVDMHICCAIAKGDRRRNKYKSQKGRVLVSHRWILSSDSYKASEVYEKIPA